MPPRMQRLLSRAPFDHVEGSLGGDIPRREAGSTRGDDQRATAAQLLEGRRVAALSGQRMAQRQSGIEIARVGRDARPERRRVVAAGCQGRAERALAAALLPSCGTRIVLMLTLFP